MKGSEKSKQNPLDEKYEEEEDSDDEMPEAVSNASMKSDYELLNKQISDFKEKVRQDKKAKRRERQDKFIAQKKAKIDASDLPDDETQESIEEDASADKLSKNVKAKLAAKPTRKLYPSLNITVEPLNKIHDSRASSAIDFKSRRLAKVPRESVKVGVIAYQKKLQVRK